MQRTYAAQEIDELTVTTIPVLIGRRRSLFGQVDGDVPLRLVPARSYPFGFVQTEQVVERLRERT